MRALVSRPRDDAERIAAPLRAMGVDVVCEPLLVIVPVAGPNVDLTGVQAVLMTSANGARALATAVERRDVPVYAVGDQTARAAREVGFVSVTSAGGDVETLAALVRRTLNPARGPLVHAAGAARAGDLAGALEADGFDVRLARLYDARPTAALSAAVRGALERGEIDVAFFYSPRTARTFVDHVRKAGLQGKLGRMTAYALSPAVARELDPLFPGRVRVAAQPTQDALLDVFTADVKEAPLKQPQNADKGTPTDRTEDSTDDAPTGPPPGATDDKPAPAAPDSADAASQGPWSKDRQDTATDGPESTDAAAQPGAEDESRTDAADGSDASESAHDDTTDKNLDDGEGIYGGSAGNASAHRESPRGPTEEEQADHRTLRSLVRWTVVLILLVAVGFGTMPWWRASVPAPFQAWLPDLPAAPDPPAVVELRERIASLDSALADVRAQADEAAKVAGEALETAQSAPDTASGAGAGVDSAALDALRERLSDLEDRVDGQTVASAGGTDSAAAAEAAQALLADIDARLADLEQTIDGLDADFGDLSERVAALESMVDDTEPRSVGLVLAVGQLRDRVAIGKPYGAALDAVRSLASETDFEDDLAALAAHAQTGVPTLPELRWRYAEVSRVAARRVIVPEGEGWWTDTVSSLMSGLTVRRKDEVVAGSALSALSAAETHLAENDLETAIDALSTLEGDPANAVADWLVDARALASVNAALANLNAAALERVGAAQTTE
ncbi:uroporphyrinogen-III synthase [uncultured Rhodospira sp.]|uniref:uroporphyrinogen-III synthase n=1 Tax=uncultured Rhodospira sp. TaxID=1936189 RepID=UPI0026101AE8|nr:uroporphyrinogen-III synthase [uncultured Rhodospira sp.]